MEIPFNKPFQTGNELSYIAQAANSGQLSGNGLFAGRCNKFFEEKFGFKNCYLTTSCTDALEMAAILIDIKPGDEVIIPTFTFVSTALAFYREGAKIVFADSGTDHPGMDEKKLERLITPKTRAIVVVHYAGVACNMKMVMKLADKYNLIVVEDAAHSIDSYYYDKPLGSIGQLACFSFHETKNLHCGEGGMLVVNDERFIERAEIIREKGTNRSSFERKEVQHYEWVDTGSSFLPSELNAAFLYAQLEQIDKIQKKRKILWDHYFSGLGELAEKGFIRLPYIPEYASNNANLFYIICSSENERNSIIKYLKSKNIQAVFHYRCLHNSKFMLKVGKVALPNLLNAENYEKKLLRMPLYTDLTLSESKYIINTLYGFFDNSGTLGKA
jgi:dTDP-4-amino-4,6-dideoxygalactose transaminase